MVEEEVKDNGHGVYDDSKDVAPTPLKRGVEIESSCDWRTEDGERDRSRKNEGVYWTSEAVGYEFTQDDVER